MNQVAEACGVSKPSLYHYVDDKYQLLVEITQGHIDRLRALVADEAAQAATAPDARLRELIVRFMAAYADAQAAAPRADRRREVPRAEGPRAASSTASARSSRRSRARSRRRVPTSVRRLCTSR